MTSFSAHWRKDCSTLGPCPFRLPTFTSVVATASGSSTTNRLALSSSFASLRKNTQSAGAVSEKPYSGSRYGTGSPALRWTTSLSSAVTPPA